jgi:hypothetical protein
MRPERWISEIAELLDFVRSLSHNPASNSLADARTDAF